MICIRAYLHFVAIISIRCTRKYGKEEEEKNALKIPNKRKRAAATARNMRRARERSPKWWIKMINTQFSETTGHRCMAAPLFFPLNDWQQTDANGIYDYLCRLSTTNRLKIVSRISAQMYLSQCQETGLHSTQSSSNLSSVIWAVFVLRPFISPKLENKSNNLFWAFVYTKLSLRRRPLNQIGPHKTHPAAISNGRQWNQVLDADVPRYALKRSQTVMRYIGWNWFGVDSKELNFHLLPCTLHRNDTIEPQRLQRQQQERNYSIEKCLRVFSIISIFTPPIRITVYVVLVRQLISLLLRNVDSTHLIFCFIF